MDKNTVNLIIEYTDFEVYEKDGKYYYYDYNDCKFTPLVLIAKEHSDELEDLDDLDIIAKYDCHICGESIDGEYYYWFRYAKEILYLIRVDWSNGEDSGCDVYVTKTLAAAIDKMKKLIEDEKENTWVGDVFDEKGDVIEGYELVTNINNPGTDRQAYWLLSDEIETLIYTHITIEPMEAR